MNIKEIIEIMADQQDEATLSKLKKVYRDWWGAGSKLITELRLTGQIKQATKYDNMRKQIEKSVDWDKTTSSGLKR